LVVNASSSSSPSSSSSSVQDEPKNGIRVPVQTWLKKRENADGQEGSWV
jgi:hypothetical protein